MDLIDGKQPTKFGKNKKNPKNQNEKTLIFSQIKLSKLTDFLTDFLTDS